MFIHDPQRRGYVVRRQKNAEYRQKTKIQLKFAREQCRNHLKKSIP